MSKKFLPVSVVMGLLLVGVVGVSAQWQQYRAAYPEWPFAVEAVLATGNNKCSVWKSRYQRGEGDQPGAVWSIPIEEAHQYQRYQLSGGKPMLVSTYLPSGNRLETMEYFYRENLLSAIEVLTFDSLQKSKVKYALQYLYYKEKDVPAQRTKLYGPPHSRVRVLDEFEFDDAYRLTRQKSTVVGFSPHMDSLLGLKADEKRLVSVQYEDTVETKKLFQDMHLILDDRKTFLNADKKPVLTEVRNAKGEKLWTIDYQYEEGVLTKKVYWVRRTASVSQQEPTSAKVLTKQEKPEARKVKPKTASQTAVPVPLRLLEPVVYKIEYFRYNEDGLLEQHLVEEENQQTVLEYSYFTE